MSTINSKNVQVGTSTTASQNFTLYQPATPDGTVRLGVGNSGATTLDAVTVTSAGNVTVSGAVTGGAVTATSLTVSGNNISSVNSLGFRNRIINGGMVIDQRNNGSAVTVNSGAAFYPVDRFAGSGQATDGVFTLQRSTTAPAGFTNSLLATVTTPDSSLGAIQQYIVGQNIEGFNVSDLRWGAAGAQTVTISFWVRSSLTGTFGGSVVNNGFNRSYPFTYTINVANTFEYKTVTIAGDTSGTWLTDNGVGLRLLFSLGAGASYLSTAGTWGGSYFAGATGQTQVISTNGATWFITGVQLEAGNVATPFECRDYGTELVRCQRYYWEDPLCSIDVYALGTAAAVMKRLHPVPMRTTPTITQNGAVVTSQNTSNTVFSVDAGTSNQLGTNIFITATGANRTFLYRPFQASAEL